jgi:hypothetical protein
MPAIPGRKLPKDCHLRHSSSKPSVVPEVQAEDTIFCILPLSWLSDKAAASEDFRYRKTWHVSNRHRTDHLRSADSQIYIKKIV